MDTISRTEAGAQRGSGMALPRLIHLARAVRRVYLQLFGIPDYERYLGHMALHHPGEPVLSQRKFYAWAMDRKYRRGGQRCC
jgi:uncharacterized short protein YbdD (DUF466 family)